jgi:hypothetical protein
VELNPEGILILKGRSIVDDPTAFYNPILEWISNCKSKSFTFEMRLEYMNTGSYKMMFNILTSIKDHYNITNILIKWYYDHDDKDMLETGREIESIIHLPIDFYEIQPK